MNHGLLVITVVATALTLTAPETHAQGNPKKGGEAYGACASCHSLKPGVHLSGPSLANMWGRSAASVPDFRRYTGALKNAAIVWDENTLNAWLADPQAMVLGSTMRFRGIRNDRQRADLIAFLKQATVKGGLATAINSGLVTADMAAGQVPAGLSSLGPESTITSIRHCGDGYSIATADGTTHPLWENNVRIKIDASPRGPKSGKPVLLQSGMVGDRFSVVFSSVADLNSYLKEKC